MIIVGHEPSSGSNDTRETAGWLSAVGAFAYPDAGPDAVRLWLSSGFNGSVGGEDDPVDYINLPVGELTRAVHVDLVIRYERGLSEQFIEPGTVGQSYGITLQAEGALARTAELTVSLGLPGAITEYGEAVALLSEVDAVMLVNSISPLTSPILEQPADIAYAQLLLDQYDAINQFGSDLANGVYSGDTLNALRDAARDAFSEIEAAQVTLDTWSFGTLPGQPDHAAQLRTSVDAMDAMITAWFEPQASLEVNGQPATRITLDSNGVVGRIADPDVPPLTNLGRIATEGGPALLQFTGARTVFTGNILEGNFETTAVDYGFGIETVAYVFPDAETVVEVDSAADTALRMERDDPPPDEGDGEGGENGEPGEDQGPGEDDEGTGGDDVVTRPVPVTDPVVLLQGLPDAGRPEPDQAVALLPNGWAVFAWANDDDFVEFVDSGDGFVPVTALSSIVMTFGRLDGSISYPPVYVQDSLWGEQYGPVIAAHDDGRFVIAWHDADGGMGADSSAMRVRVFGSNGEPLSEDWEFVPGSPWGKADLSVAILGDDSYFLVWTDRVDRDGWPSVVYGRIMDSRADSVDAIYTLGPVWSQNGHDSAHVAALADGGAVVVWRNDGAVVASEAGLWLQRVDLESKFEAPAVPVATAAGTAVAMPVVAGLSDGGFVLVWIEAGTPGSTMTRVMAQVFDGIGMVRADAIEIAALDADAGLHRPVVAGLSEEGAFVVSWWSGPDPEHGAESPGGRAQVLSADGRRLGDVLVLDTPASSILAREDGSFTVIGRQEAGTEQAPALDLVVQTFDASRLLAAAAPAMISGEISGVVVEDSIDDQSTAGMLEVEGGSGGPTPFGSADETALTGSFGTFAFDPDTGAWSYTLANDDEAVQALPEGAEVTDSLTVTSFDGSVSATVTVTIIGANDPASIAGDTAGAVTEDDPDRQQASGVLTVSDPDAGEDRFRDPDPAALQGDFGAFSFDAVTGAWSYALANDSASVQALPEGAEVTDSLTVTSLDGTASETITVTITGTGIREDESPEAVALAGQVVDRAGRELAGTTVTFTPQEGNASSAITDATGRFIVDVPADAAGAMEAARAHTAADPRITTASALETLRMAVGLEPSWGPAQPMDLIAADFNGDGRVTTTDALNILRVAVGLTADASPRWVFVDQEADLSGLTRSNTQPDFGIALDQPTADVGSLVMVGVLIGDVQSYV